MEERPPTTGDEAGTRPPTASEGEGSAPAAPADEAELRRDREARVLTGVCAGLGGHTGVDPVVWRVAFALTALAGGTGVWLYVAAWAMMRDPHGSPALAEQICDRRLAPQAVLTLLADGLALSTAVSLLGGVGWDTLVLATPLIIGALTARNRGVDLGQAARELPTLLRSAGPMPEPAHHPQNGPRAGAAEPVDLSIVNERACRENGAAPDPGDGSRRGFRRVRETARKARERCARRGRDSGAALLPLVLAVSGGITVATFALAGGAALDAGEGDAGVPVWPPTSATDLTGRSVPALEDSRLDPCQGPQAEPPTIALTVKAIPDEAEVGHGPP